MRAGRAGVASRSSEAAYPGGHRSTAAAGAGSPLPRHLCIQHGHLEALCMHPFGNRPAFIIRWHGHSFWVATPTSEGGSITISTPVTLCLVIARSYCCSCDRCCSGGRWQSCQGPHQLVAMAGGLGEPSSDRAACLMMTMMAFFESAWVHGYLCDSKPLSE